MSNKKKMPETSKEAYKSLDPSQLAEIYRKILASLSVLGEADFEEIASHAKLEKSRVWKRLSELQKMDLIYRPGNKRRLRSGRMGFTWMLTSAALPKTINREKALKGTAVHEYAKKLIPISKNIQQELFHNT